ncbi:MAG: beta-N-acetylhexosaminidase [Pseudomonadota bacterium]
MHPVLDLTELDAKVGRLFMAGMPGTEMDPETEALIRDYCLGGVILFSRNIADPIQLARLCRNLQNAAMGSHGVPLFLAIDQEGGRVSRLREPFTQFQGNEAIGSDPSPIEKAAEFALTTAREMTLVGLNMDLAPVVDVRKGEPEKHLEGRTFGDDPRLVGVLGGTVVRVLQENGVMAVAKHFPGLGRTSLDPHYELPTIDADGEEMEEVNLPPFRSAIAEGVSAIMTSHAIYPAMDPGLPGTLSRKVLKTLLRDELGFKGLIITDDLEMGAISRAWGVANGASLSFEAGGDILLICKDQGFVLEAIESIKGRLLKGEVPFQRLHRSIERIMDAKSRFLKGRKKILLKEVRSYFSL